MSMAEASPPTDILARCVEVCAQPEKIAAATALVLAANFTKSRLEIVDHSFSMAYLLSVLERYNQECNHVNFKEDEIPTASCRMPSRTSDDFSQIVTPEFVNRGPV